MSGEGAGDGSATGDALPLRIVLVGFMAAGKTTVGRGLADALGYRFLDLDSEVERLAGRSIAEIFREEGEAAFRELEAEVTRRADGLERVVIAAGGGWMARSELRDRWPEAVRVWLRVSPEGVLRRIGAEVASRPMLDAGDPGGSARDLLERRRDDYALAEHAVETDGRDAEEVVRELLALLGAE